MRIEVASKMEDAVFGQFVATLRGGAGTRQCRVPTSSCVLRPNAGQAHGHPGRDAGDAVEEARARTAPIGVEGIL